MTIAAKISIVVAVSACVLVVGMSLRPKAPDDIAQEALCLAEACRMTALMNEDKWDEVAQMLGTSEGMITILRRNAGFKDWMGIGAYRGSRLDQDSPRRVTFRFGFAPRSNAHEIWISYDITDTGHSKPGLMVLGW